MPLMIGGDMGKTLQEELDELAEAAAPIKKAFAEPILSVMAWLDRQLRRWPRLYAYLSR